MRAVQAVLAGVCGSLAIHWAVRLAAEPESGKAALALVVMGALAGFNGYSAWKAGR